MITEDFTAFAGKLAIEFPKGKSGVQMKAVVSETVSQVAKECIAAGTRLIGHIKCIAEVEDGKYIACSVVDEKAEAACRGELSDGSRHLSVILNVLIYGLDRERVEDIVHDVAENVASKHGGKAKLEDIDPSHACEADHEHDHEHHH